MTVSDRWWLHGLTVASRDLDLDALRASGSAPADVTITVANPGVVPAYGETLPGRVVAHYDDEHGSALSVVVRTESSGSPLVDICFHGVGLATWDSADGDVVLTMDREADPGLASVLVSGTVISVILILQGHPVLHASSAVVPGARGPEAFAFVGASGMGKSTMTTLLCRDGARLLTDDVLRTDVLDDTSVIAWPGATALRLRPSARGLGAETVSEMRTTADGRYAAAPAMADRSSVPLTALVVPQPDRDSSTLSLTRVNGIQAVLALASFPRIMGWSDPETSGAALRHWGELVRRVPLYVLDVPWGPPFSPDLGSRVVEAIQRANTG